MAAARLDASHDPDIPPSTLQAQAPRSSATAPARRTSEAVGLAAIKHDILSNLADPQLSVSQISARQRVTPRHIHMLFEAEGVTFSEYVLSQRLASAHRKLLDPRFAAQSISRIAVGFGDISYFNRTFRRRFGTTPSDVRQQCQQEEQ